MYPFRFCKYYIDDNTCVDRDSDSALWYRYSLCHRSRANRLRQQRKRKLATVDTIDPDGNDMAQVTDLAATDFELWFPGISQDGRQIVFSYGPVDDSGNPLPDLYVINVDGTGLAALTNDGRSQSPRWSADGKWILFTQADTVSGGNRVARMRADGTGWTTVLTNRKWDSFGDSFTPCANRGRRRRYLSERPTQFQNLRRF